MATGPLPEVLGLLGDPLRWQLVEELGRCDRRVGELVEILDRPQNLVSYHLGVLRDAGVVAARRSSADGRDVYYRANLHRCRALLAEVGPALHPLLALDPGVPAGGGGRGKRETRLLFVCTGNSARSPIAQALVEHRAVASVRAASAGSHPKPLHPNAVRVLAERGIDIAGRRSTGLNRFARQRFERVITLCDKVRELSAQLPRAAVLTHWSIADPTAAGGGDDMTYPAFVRVAEEIDERLDLLLAELLGRVA